MLATVPLLGIRLTFATFLGMVGVALGASVLTEATAATYILGKGHLSLVNEDTLAIVGTAKLPKQLPASWWSLDDGSRLVVAFGGKKPLVSIVDLKKLQSVSTINLELKRPGYVGELFS